MSVLAAMDDAAHELFTMALIGLGLDPQRGRPFGLKPSDPERALPVGPHGLVVYTLDEVERVVQVVSIIWTG